MNFFKDPQYSSVRVFLLIVIIAIAGYFIFINISDRQANQEGLVYNDWKKDILEGGDPELDGWAGGIATTGGSTTSGSAGTISNGSGTSGTTSGQTTGGEIGSTGQAGTIVTKAVSGVGYDWASLNATYAGTKPSQQWFQWGTSQTNLSHKTSGYAVGNMNTAAFLIGPALIQNNKTYYFQAYAKYGSTIKQGEILSFTTGCQPSVPQLKINSLNPGQILSASAGAGLYVGWSTCNIAGTSTGTIQMSNQQTGKITTVVSSTIMDKSENVVLPTTLENGTYKIGITAMIGGVKVSDISGGILQISNVEEQVLEQYN
ncbi:hypothetical protein IPF86_01055 [Candidatus Nomurabacteria bacterium]|nr:MAG: hypothetical protein IPF86_01055 [Candidatus Nomurabacteria bacterium]